MGTNLGSTLAIFRLQERQLFYLGSYFYSTIMMKLIFLAQHIYHKEEGTLCLLFDTKAIDVYKILIKLRACIHVSSV
jgi:hypothetical protein